MPVSLFETEPHTIECTEIKDGYGNSIQVPVWGCCSWAEKAAIEHEMESERTATTQQVNIVAAFLRLRLRDRIEKGITTEALLSNSQGQPLTEPMIEALYQFTMGEYNRNRPKEQVMTISGEGAKKVAIQTAKQESFMVVTRPDLELQNIYYLFRNSDILGALNQGRTQQYYIVNDFSPEQKVGKQKASAKQ
jgi:hypothetical protein